MQRTLLIWEGVSLVAEDSILVFEPPKGATRTSMEGGKEREEPY